MRTSQGVSTGIGVIGLLALIVGFGAWLRDRRILGQVFGKWSMEQVALLSDSVYSLSFTDPQFSWSRRRVRVDSIALVTDTARLQGRKDSLPRLRIVFRDCELSGVQLVPLALGRGLNAHRFGCGGADLAVEIPPVRRRPRPSGEGARPFMVVTRSIELPERVPAIRITGVMFPSTRLSLAQRRFSGARVDLSLILDWRLRGVNIDPRDLGAMLRPLFSEEFTLAADSVRFRPEPNLETRIAHVGISVTDSTLELRDFQYGPTVSDTERARTQRYRESRIRAAARRVTYAGLDLTQLAEGNGLTMRRLEVDSAILDVLSDKRLPPAPRRKSRLTPQEWVAELDRGVRIDSVILREGTIAYREMHPSRDAPGVLVFSGVDALATQVRHEPGGDGQHEPMKLRLTSRLMDEADLQATFTVPLDAPQFVLSVEGTVGPMDVTAMNRFMQRVAPVQIKSGRLDSVRFQVVVKNGVARGSVMPLYDDLALDVTGEGMGGLLGKRGVIGNIARGVAEVAVNEFGVRRANPDGGGSPLSGRVSHPFQSDETLPAFLWNGIREGLVDVVKKRRTAEN